MGVRSSSDMSKRQPGLTHPTSAHHRPYDEEDERWAYGVYTREQVVAVGREVAEQGYSLLYDVDGLTVAIPQFHLLSELEGKLIDEADGRLHLGINRH